MELIVFLFGLVGVLYGIWALISPFIVIGLTSRVNLLEGQLEKLQRERKRESARDAPHVVADVVERKPAADSSATRPGLAAEIAGTSGEAATPETLSPSPVEPRVAPPRPFRKSQPWNETLQGISQRLVPNDKVQDLVHRITTEPAAVEPTPIEASGVESNSARTTFQSVPDSVLDESIGAPSGGLHPPLALVGSDRDEPSTLEEVLGGKWLTWVGALAVIIGSGFGFKYAIENNWIGPRERIIIGILTGLICFAGGAYAMRRKYVFLAQGLTGAALGVLYLSFYAAFGWYDILSYEAAFVGMILTTTLGLSFAGHFNVQPTAVLGMLGGFLTPAMLWPDQDPMWTLFPYLLLLDLGVLVIAGVRRWAGLEVLAFCGTLVIWFYWYRQFFSLDVLPQTGGFMTAFLVLFALLSVWHNVIRKRKAMAGDFFLIFATPTVYFTALYTLTYERYPHWQGEFALSIMLFYTVLAALAAVWHPAGKSVIAALAGLASTFMILSVPLELTGHWVAICWIAQAVLLVELGLYFRERSLAWTGLALLAKVQGILLIYFVGTLADPIHFQTAFVRIQLHLIGRPETPIDTATGLMSLINGRSLSYLADVIGFSILAWELGRRRRDPTLIDAILPQRAAFQLWLNVTVPVVALAMIVLETFAWGSVWKWDAATIVSAWMIWTSLFACGAILWGRALLSRGIEDLGWLLFILLACFVGFETIEALQLALSGTQIPPHRLEARWLLNPRGVGILSVIAASGLAALMYGIFLPRQSRAGQPEKYSSRQLMELFGTSAYVLSLGLVLLETRVWGAAHDWSAATIVSACAIWTTAFLLASLPWIVWKPRPWVENILRGTFILLQFWFVVNALSAVGSLNATGYYTTLSTYEWWSQNVRGMGFLASALGCAVAGWVLSYVADAASVGADAGSTRHVAREPVEPVWPLPYWLGVAAYVMCLVMFMLETTRWGLAHQWRVPTMISASALWVALFMVGATVWRVWQRAAWMDRIVLPTFCLLELLLVILAVGAVDPSTTRTDGSLRAFRLPIEWWILNPRSIGFLGAIGAASISARLYRGQHRLLQIYPAELPNGSPTMLDVSNLFGIAVYVMGVVMCTLEVYSQGTSRDWHTATSLAVTLVWTGYATLTLIVGIMWRSGWVRVFSLGLFVLTVVKVFLFDVWHLETFIRVFAFISLGVALLLVSFLYRRFRDRIRSWMSPGIMDSGLPSQPTL